MNRRIVIPRFLKWFFILFVVVYTWQATVIIFEKNHKAPVQFSAYLNNGYYEFDPFSIMTHINQEDSNVFVPFLGDWDRDEPNYDSAVFSQMDYLKIGNALSMQALNEPLDTESWKVVFIGTEKGCENEALGLQTFTIAYYKFLGINNWTRQYTTRLIEIHPQRGLARWGTDAVFDTPLLIGWHGVSLAELNIDAEDAMQIAKENGGEDAQLESYNDCRIRITMNQQSPLYFHPKWIVNYDGTDFNIHINTYAYDYTNPLVWFNGTNSYAYSGLGDRHQQKKPSVTLGFFLSKF